MSWEFAITGVITLLIGIFGSTGFWTYRTAKREKNSEVYKKIDDIEIKVDGYIEKMQQMMMGQTYVNIVRTCEYWIERGWVEQDDIRDLEHYMYDPYREWGGNGTAERLFNRACQLPNKPTTKEVQGYVEQGIRYT